jgi:peptidoglycan hydrolase CwlO-like protein
VFSIKDQKVKIKFQKYFLFLILFATCSVLLVTLPAYAEDPTPTPDSSKSKELSELDNKIKELEKKVSELKSQENSLSSQIGVMDNQIKLTEYRMNATKQEIMDITLDIDSATKRMKNLEGSLTDVSKVLLNRIVATYKAGGYETLPMLLTSTSFTSALSRANYLRIVQQHDKELLLNTQQARNDYANQKQIFEDKRKKIEALKAQLEAYTGQLEQEKEDKDALLQQTKNQDNVYQRQLSAARAEQAAILQIGSGGGNAVASGPVNEGDVVGYIINGASACSTGAHLHFEVHKDGSLQDAANFLASKSVTWRNQPDGQFSFNGSWQFPLMDPIQIFQGFGMTSFARSGFYGGGPHTGIDMYSTSSLAVHAVKPGQLYRGGISCGGGTLLFARVDQSDGTQSFYLHILP